LSKPFVVCVPISSESSKPTGTNPVRGLFADRGNYYVFLATGFQQLSENELIMSSGYHVVYSDFFLAMHIPKTIKDSESPTVDPSFEQVKPYR
jgi:hypothetical protein